MIKEIRYQIAYQLLFSIGFSTENISLKTSILETAKKLPTLNNLSYKEYYFYEEVVFACVLCLEAEIRYGFIEYMIKEFKKEKNIPSEILPMEIYKATQEILYSVACERMKLVGFSSTLSNDLLRLESFFCNRFIQYERLLKDHIASSSYIDRNRGAWEIGLSERKTPLEKYLGAVSDNIANSLEIEVQALDQTAIELAVTMRWNLVMKCMQDL